MHQSMGKRVSKISEGTITTRRRALQGFTYCIAHVCEKSPGGDRQDALLLATPAPSSFAMRALTYQCTCVALANPAPSSFAMRALTYQCTFCTPGVPATDIRLHSSACHGVHPDGWYLAAQDFNPHVRTGLGDVLQTGRRANAEPTPHTAVAKKNKIECINV